MLSRNQERWRALVCHLPKTKNFYQGEQWFDRKGGPESETLEVLKLLKLYTDDKHLFSTEAKNSRKFRHFETYNFEMKSTKDFENIKPKRNEYNFLNYFQCLKN